MGFDRDGGHDFDALWNRTNDDQVRLCVFDLLELNGITGRSRYWRGRNGSLGCSRRPAMVSTTSSTWRATVRLSSSTFCKLKLEGIVSKRVDSLYRSGPSRSWRKVKNREHPAYLRVIEALR
jgi:ATP-dependent DNA ligase